MDISKGNHRFTHEDQAMLVLGAILPSSGALFWSMYVGWRGQDVDRCGDTYISYHHYCII
jgi:hypothetical protein